MKRIYYIVMFLGLVSCTPVVIAPPSTSTSIREVTTETPIVLHATPSETPIIPTVTSTLDSIIRRDYDPAEWQQIYDKDMVWQIEVTPSQQVWILAGYEDVGYFAGDEWILFSAEDYGFIDGTHAMAMAPDGSIWISGHDTLSHYQDGHWEVFPIPNIGNPSVTRLAISPSGEVWVSTPLCFCDNNLRKFDGAHWEELSITDKHFRTYQLLFADDGTLWAALDLPGGIGQYDGTSWKIYSVSDLWPTDYYRSNRIASDDQGNIYSIYEGQKRLIRISNDGDVTTIPFDYQNLSLFGPMLRLFIDSQGTIWLNAGLNDGNALGVAYYRDDQWVCFVNLPFSFITDINQLADGTMLIASEKGLFQFRHPNISLLERER